MGDRIAPPPPRLSTKPLPTTVAAWRAEILGIGRFMLQAIDWDTGEIAGWSEGMLLHYTFRLADLQANKPKKPRGRPRRE